MKNDIYFHLPDFYTGCFLYRGLKLISKKFPEMFRDNFKISSVFGSFPGMIWNGGGCNIQGRIIDYGTMCQFIQLYEELEIPIRFTLTNPLITEEHLNDSYCNEIINLAHTGKHEILVVSPILEKYLKEKYPNFKYIRSILQSENEYYNLNGYEMSVLKRQKNNDWDYLNTIPKEDRNKIEFLCNEDCLDNCPRTYSHYNNFGFTQLHFGKEQTLNDNNCSQKTHLSFGDYKRMKEGKGFNSNYISPEDIITKYAPLGYRHFKVSGRGNLIRMIEETVRYLIKEEYQEDVRIFIWREYFKNFNFLQNINMPPIMLPLEIFGKKR